MAAWAATIVAATATACSSPGMTASWSDGQPLSPSAPVAAATGSPTTTSSATGSASPSVPARPPAGCAIFPADNVWHADVSRLPVLGDSARYVASIGTARGVHADFGSGNYEGAPIGIPITTVPAGQAAVTVSFEYASESDRGPYPIPANPKIEGGPSGDGDRHIILYDQNSCRSYELYAAYPTGNGGWKAGSGAVFDLRANAMRAKGATSADAAGLSILAGLVRYEEVAAGRIDHAIRVTAPKTRNTYVWPARHAASSSSDPALPPMGLRLRLKSSVDITGLPAQARIVAQAMKTYGLILADNGSPWYISGAPDDRWNNDALHALGGLTGADFEAVDGASLMVSPDSSAARR